MKTSGNNYRLVLFFVISAWISGYLVQCSQPETRKIDVDEIQTQVDILETRLQRMQAALDKRELENAQEIYDAITDGLKENREQLAAYPEYALLRDHAQAAGSNLCYEHANTNLERFYKALRAKEPDRARNMLTTSQDEFQRCKPIIQRRPDFVALRMNLESAPGALKELEKRLIKEAHLEKIQNLQKQLSSEIEAIQDKLARYKKEPEQKNLFDELEEEFRQVRTEIESVKEFENQPTWMSFVKKTKHGLEWLDKQRLTCRRQGDLLEVARSLLPQADVLVAEAAKLKDRAQALKLMKEAVDAYSRCGQTVFQILKTEPRLARISVVYKGKKKNAAWLKRFCKLQQQRTQKKIRRLKSPGAGSSGRNKTGKKK